MAIECTLPSIGGNYFYLISPFRKESTKYYSGV